MAYRNPYNAYQPNVTSLPDQMYMPMPPAASGSKPADHSLGDTTNFVEWAEGKM
jgi:hypothetical protein